MTSFRRSLGDESFWIAVAALVGAVLASVGLGSLSHSAVAVVDAVAGVVLATYTGGAAHKAATAAKAAAPASATASLGSVAPALSPSTGDPAADAVNRLAAAIETIAPPKG